jgi:hypothetical protein
MSYATTTDIDQVIGKIPVASGVLRQGFLDSAEAIMHTYMIGIYNVPIEVKSSVATTISGVTYNILNTVQKNLAAGNLLLSLTTSIENDAIHDYGRYLVETATDTLKNIKTQKIILPGATIDTDPSDDVVKPTNLQYSSPDGTDVARDSGSYFNRPYEQVAKKENEVTGGIDL